MAINLSMLHGLPIVCIDVVFLGRQLRLEKVLLDTGSAGTILDADKVAEIGVRPEGTDRTAIIHGIGGTEIVFTKWFDAVVLGDWKISQCKIETGAMDYGIEIDGILGFDFIREVGLIIDTSKMQMYVSN